MKNKSYEMDMCNGPLFGKILLFAVPLMLSGILQLLFNAAAIVVVGRFAGSQALAAVGSTSSLINLLINVFVGLSVGANVLVARYYGCQASFGAHGDSGGRAGPVRIIYEDLFRRNARAHAVQLR